MDYQQLRKLDDESARKMQEGSGPVDECLCSLLAPADGEKRSIGASIKKAFAAITPNKRKRSARGGGGAMGGALVEVGALEPGGGRGGVDIPLVFTKGQQGVYTTKEVVRRKGSCGKCGCDKEKIVLKHSYANIRITSPDVSSICSCPNDCLPDKTKLMNNIRVTVERVKIDPDSENSETSLHYHRPQKILKEPDMSDKKSLNSLINAQYETDEEHLFDR